MHSIETSHTLAQQENAIREMEWLNKKIRKDNVKCITITEEFYNEMLLKSMLLEIKNKELIAENEHYKNIINEHKILLKNLQNILKPQENTNAK